MKSINSNPFFNPFFYDMTHPESSSTRAVEVAAQQKQSCLKTPDGIRYEFEVPGFKREDFKVEVHGQQLVVTGIKASEISDTSDSSRIRSRSNAAFRRTATIPVDSIISMITAKCENGILEVNVPVAPEPGPISIKID